jgi:hypothetical protein
MAAASEGKARTFTPCHADAVDIDLEAEAALLLEYAGGESRPHPRGRDLAGRVHDVGDLVWLHQRGRHGRQLYGLAGRVLGTLGVGVGHGVLVGRLGVG